jgi:hypothetical protein
MPRPTPPETLHIDALIMEFFQHHRVSAHTSAVVEFVGGKRARVLRRLNALAARGELERMKTHRRELRWRQPIERLYL